MSAPKRNVAWVKPQQPAFLQAFKAKVGYREPDTIDAKRARVAPSGEGGEGGGASDEERDDEQPTVVVLKKGDVEEEEYQKFLEALKEKKKDEKAEGGGEKVGNDGRSDGGHEAGSKKKEEVESGKIVFKRPVKRRRSSEGVLDASTKKTGDQGGSPRERERKVRTRKGSGSSSGVKNSSLLSFGDEDV